ncbi:hypothetical protein [Nocardiopsis synnemataformans]|uniref:hypothetical protein n=1 Tax=Nocardiopsis synnemataformans TaxID=61305 RepID=UPI003EB6E794
MTDTPKPPQRVPGLSLTEELEATQRVAELAQERAYRAEAALGAPEPTFDRCVFTASAVLTEARSVAGMDSAERLTAITDSWLAMAHLIHTRETGGE